MLMVISSSSSGTLVLVPDMRFESHDVVSRYSSNSAGTTIQLEDMLC